MTQSLILAGLLMTAPFTCIIAAEEASHGHVAAHGGCLNELGECENGHAEVKIDDKKFRLWFVGGGTQTTKAVRVAAASITLTTKVESGKPAQTITLTAKPLTLAEEKVGDCSYFEGEADWLKDVKRLTLTGKVLFKGSETAIMIEWPNGYDSDQDEKGADKKKDNKESKPAPVSK